MRFYYRLYGTTYVGLGLYIVHLKPHINESVQVFWTFKEKNVGIWQDQVKTLPKIEYKYYLQFEVSQSYESKIGVAIDDISLSPECFGIGEFYYACVVVNFYGIAMVIIFLFVF